MTEPIRIPAGSIKVLKTSKKIQGGRQRIDFWEASWRPSSPVEGLRVQGTRYAFRAGSKYGEQDAIRRVKFMVAVYFGYEWVPPRNRRLAIDPVVDEANGPWTIELEVSDETRRRELAGKKALKEIREIEETKSTIVRIPDGVIKFVLELETYGPFRRGDVRVRANFSVEWQPLGEAGEILASKIFNRTRSGGLFYGPSAPLEQVRRRILVAASGLTPSKRHGVLPKVSKESNPWGGPLVELGREIVPGVSKGELRQFYRGRGNRETGHIGEYGHFYRWTPARVFDKAPEGVRSWITGFGKTSQAAFDNCLHAAIAWVKENYPEEALLPPRPAIETFVDIDYLSGLLEAPIPEPTRHRSSFRRTISLGT